MSEVKDALDLYLAQYDATDKLWAYFSTVTLGIIGFSVASEKASNSFVEASMIVAVYLLFCVGNFSALALSQAQLVEFAELARKVAEKNGVSMKALHPFSPAQVAWFYWVVAGVVPVSIMVITWRRRKKSEKTTSLSNAA